jgi:hypothetical protein
MVKINFEFDSEYGTFRDAIVLPDDHTMTDAEIDALKQKRFDNWKEAVKPSEEEGEE